MGIKALVWFLIFLGTVLAMELFAYFMHRWVMHGPGWFLHASHHRPPKGRFEANDLYAVVFALPSIVLIYGGVNLAWGGWASAVGAGIATYGLIYFLFHDVLVHRRVGHRFVARSTYLKRIVQAHRLHHAVETRQDAVSFGFLYAPRAERLAEQLAHNGHRGVRAPTRASIEG
jgi:beta-carotene 3-hydroxylase